MSPFRKIPTIKRSLNVKICLQHYQSFFNYQFDSNIYTSPWLNGFPSPVSHKSQRTMFANIRLTDTKNVFPTYHFCANTTHYFIPTKLLTTVKLPAFHLQTNHAAHDVLVHFPASRYLYPKHGACHWLTCHDEDILAHI